MTSGEEQRYGRCITCGKWIPESDRIAERFCSKACSQRYISCRSCGNYMEQHNGSNGASSKDTEVCPYCGAALTMLKIEEGGIEK